MLRSVVQQRDIIGQVKAPAGLLALVVNDRKIKVDDRGLFQTNIKLMATDTLVHVVAVDKNGAKATLDFNLSLRKVTKLAKSMPAEKSTLDTRPWRNLSFGRYFALIIGNNHYEKVPSLNTPINDARAVDKVLKEKYGFKTELLLDGSRYKILSVLNEFRSKLTEKDNFLIYYAGHGELDKKNMRGHWLPIDADDDNTANWISTVAISDLLNMMPVKHIIVVADSCYSGAMTRSSLARLETGYTEGQKFIWVKAMLKARSRTVLTSGGLKPVLDSGGGDHSIFAQAFIKTLQNNRSLLEGQVLYRKIASEIVARASNYGFEQVPEYAPIRHAGHEAGEFFFVPTEG